MSLTSEIERKESPVARFFVEHFGSFDKFWDSWKLSVRELPTIRPEGRVPWGTVGTALDYRIRYYFGETPWSQLVAANGAALLTGRRLVPLKDGSVRLVTDFHPSDGPSPAQARWETMVGAFADELERVVGTVNPVGRKLPRDEETELCQFCYVLALFEELYRAGPSIRSPLLEHLPSTPADLLIIPSELALEDLCRLSWTFYDSCEELLTKPAVLNPTFAGSKAIGGADADLIVDSCLIDIKATVNPLKRGDVRSWIYQVIGYVLLDYDAGHKVDRVAIYLARQGALLEWDLATLLAKLAVGSVPPIAELREEMRAAVDSSRRRP